MASVAAPAVSAHQAGAYKWYVAAVLCAAHTVSIIDRFIMVLVTEPVRAVMDLSDTQLGLLQGTGFAILYCGFAVPLGCVADVVNRRKLIMLGLTLWSCATVAAAFATSFEALFAARVLVGLGEACRIPAAMSLLAAYFPPTILARGTAVFGLGANFGYGFAFLGGGAVLAATQASGGLALPGLGTLEPWQALFFCAGATAIPVLVMLIWLREPPRAHAVESAWRGQLASLREGMAYLWANLRVYAPFLIVGSCTATTGYALTSWSASLLVRLQGISTAEAGQLIGIIGIIAGPAGTITGGVILDRLRARGVAGAPLIVMGVGSVISLTTAAGLVAAPGLPLATLALVLFIFNSTLVLPPLYVGMQMLTPDRFRGVAASFNMMVYTLCGLGLGPTAVGLISDVLPQGDRTLGIAVVAVEAAMVAIILPVAFFARRSFHRRMKAVEAA